MNNVIKTPIEKEFIDLIKSSKNRIFLCAPFLKMDIIKKIFSSKNSNTELIIVTTSNISSFIKEASDIEAIEFLMNKKIPVYNYSNLHAKIYIFDEDKAIITSANLTYNGLNRNYEYGILIDQEKIINDIILDAKNMLSSKMCTLFAKSDIEYIKDIKIKYSKLDHEIYLDKDDDDILLIDSKNLISNNNTWQDIVLNLVITQCNKTFVLNDLYKFKDEISKIYPENHTIDSKIRQTLQQLRDRGLVKFYGNGHYKKLIKVK